MTDDVNSTSPIAQQVLKHKQSKNQGSFVTPQQGISIAWKANVGSSEQYNLGAGAQTTKCKHRKQVTPKVANSVRDCGLFLRFSKANFHILMKSGAF